MKKWIVCLFAGLALLTLSTGAGSESACSLRRRADAAGRHL